MNKEQNIKLFFEIYNSLENSEKRFFRDRIINECNIQYPTFYSWFNRQVIPAWHIDTALRIALDYEPQKQTA
jgi:hypothetical protein